MVLPAEGAGKICEAGLLSRQIAGLQGFTDGLEILLAIGSRKHLSILVRTGLAKSGEGVKRRLGSGEVAGLQRLSELGEISEPLLPEGLQLLVDRRRIVGGGGFAGLRAGEVYNPGRSCRW